MRTILSKQQFFSLVVSVLLSVFMVAVVTYGATMTISNTGLGSGTSTPGAALGVQGAAIVDDFIWTGALTATSTSQASGFGTTSPGAEFAVAGGALFDGRVTASSYAATSTTATSTVKWSLDVATSSLQIDGVTGRVVIGATTTLADGDIMGRAFNPDPALTITGVGNAAGATGTLYITGAAGGGEIIMKSADGTRCVSIMADTNELTLGGSGVNAGVAALLSAKIVSCPR